MTLHGRDGASAGPPPRLGSLNWNVGPLITATVTAMGGNAQPVAVRVLG